MIEHPAEVLLVIVGAGASFDCLQDECSDNAAVDTVGMDGIRQRRWGDVRPPLTKDLVAANAIVRDLATRYPQTRPLIDHLRDRLGVIPGTTASPTTTLEQALADYRDLRSTNPQAARHVAAFRFLLRDYLWASTDYALAPGFTGGFTNYTRLVRIAYEWATANRSHACFVSFNYDTLLDQACADYWGLDLEDLDSYVADDHGSLLKPHGSVRWAWRLADEPNLDGTRAAADHRIGEGEPDEPWGFPLVTGQRPDHQAHRNPTPADLPALALPIAGKADFVWPPEHRAFFDELSTRVRRVLTIGWRAAEPHFVSVLDPLVMSDHRALLVSGGPDADRDVAEVIMNLGALGKRLNWNKATDGFKGVASNPQLQWLLQPVTWKTP